MPYLSPFWRYSHLNFPNGLDAHHTHTCTCAHTHTHTRTHARARTHAYERTQTRMHKHPHTRTHGGKRAKCSMLHFSPKSNISFVSQSQLPSTVVRLDVCVVLDTNNVKHCLFNIYFCTYICKLKDGAN